MRTVSALMAFLLVGCAAEIDFGEEGFQDTNFSEDESSSGDEFDPIDDEETIESEEENEESDDVTGDPTLSLSELIQVKDAPIDFGRTDTNHYVDKSVLVTNLIDSDISGLMFELSAESNSFRVFEGCTYIASEEDCLLTIRMQSTNSGTKSGSLLISKNGGFETITIDLQGIVVSGPAHEGAGPGRSR